MVDAPTNEGTARTKNRRARRERRKQRLAEERTHEGAPSQGNREEREGGREATSSERRGMSGDDARAARVILGRCREGQIGEDEFHVSQEPMMVDAEMNNLLNDTPRDTVVPDEEEEWMVALGGELLREQEGALLRGSLR